jgi:hypothetical protein
VPLAKRLPGGSSGPSPRWPKRLTILGGSAVGVVAVSTLTHPGALIVARVHAFLEFYAGVGTLVALSLTVMGGVAATERALFPVHLRVRLQIVHRALAFMSVAFLALHIGLKILDKRAGVLDVVIPFLAAHRAIPVGLGTIAAYFMVAVLWSGVVRARFAASGRPWLWRVQHSLAYAAWPIALFHGLEAGRAAKPWVVVSYILCLILVGIVAVVRLVGWLVRQTNAPRARTAPVVPVGAATSEVPVLRVTSSGDQHAITANAHPSPAMVTVNNLLGPVPGRSERSTVRLIPARPPSSAGPPPRSARNRVRRTDPRAGVNRPETGAELPANASDEQFWAFMRGRKAR